MEEKQQRGEWKGEPLLIKEDEKGRAGKGEMVTRIFDVVVVWCVLTFSTCLFSFLEVEG